MRFVTPDVVRKELKNGKDWIEIKKELSYGEETRYRTAGMTRMRPDATDAKRAEGDGAASIEIDFAQLAVARVLSYLLDWNAKDAKGKDIPVNRHSVEALCREDFNEIDELIKAHIEEMDAEKNGKAGEPLPAMQT